MLKYDHVLLVGDFNIHVCCPDNPLVKDFLSLIDCFHLEDCVSGPLAWFVSVRRGNL